MAEAPKSTMMFVISMMLGMIAIASGFFLFSKLMGDVTEQRQTDEFIMLAAEISKTCKEIALNPNNLYTTDQFSIMIYAPYNIWYENPTSYGTDQVCQNTRCVCFGRISGNTQAQTPSDCFSLNELECPASADLTFDPRIVGYSNQLDLPPKQSATHVHYEATCKYIAKIKWDKTNLFVNITSREPLEQKYAGIC